MKPLIRELEEAARVCDGVAVKLGANARDARTSTKRKQWRVLQEQYAMLADCFRGLVGMIRLRRKRRVKVAA